MPQARTTDRRYEGVTLRMLTLAGSEYLPAVRIFAEEFKERTGAAIVFDSAPSWFLLQPWIKSAHASSAVPWDLFCNDLEFQYTLWPYFLPLTDLTAKSRYDWTGFFRPVMEYGESVPTGEHVRYGLPIRVRVPLLIYRSDLIATVPKSWDAYEQMLADLTSRDRYALGCVGAQEPMGKMFLARYCSAGDTLLSPDWKPQINSDRGVWALEMLLRQINRYAPPGVSGWNREYAIYNFLTGKVALAEGMTPPVIDIIGHRSSTVSDRWAIGRCPGSGKTEFTSHSFFIFKGSANVEAAFEFITYATNRANAQRLLAAGDYPARRDVWFTPETSSARPYLSGIADAIDASVPFAPGVSQWFDMLKVLWDGLTSCLAGRVKPKATLNDVARQWGTLLPPGGYDFPYRE